MTRLKDEHLPRADSAIRTTARCSTSRRTSTPSSSRRPITCTRPIALAAMDLGKHVYVQKPLTWSVAEARQLARKAKSTSVATQMGNQGHSWDDARTAVEYVWAGAIGDVREVHVWTNRPLGYWPQGIPRPGAAHGAAERLPLERSRHRSAARRRRWPATIRSPNGSRGICSSAPRRTSSTTRSITRSTGAAGWTGAVGAIGDMGAHLIDHSMWALDLGYPTTIETVATPFNGVCYPNATMTFYEFPARGSKPAVKLTWYDGGLLPPKPVELGDDRAEPDRRRAARRQQGQADARHLRQESAAAARFAARRRSASRRRSCRAFPTRITR